MIRIVFVAAASIVVACGGEATANAETRAHGNVDLTRDAAPPSLEGDPRAARADSLTRAGRPWRATVLLAQPLASPAGAAPELRLAGARAAAAWSGWSEVRRILTGADWLDTQYEGEGRELLARSALELGTDAQPDARRALSDARSDGRRVIREVLLARALDRANVRDSAAAHYLNAARGLGSVSDWLRLRAAGVTDDAAQRARLLKLVAGSVAQARASATDAQARERLGDFTGAAAEYRKAGDEGSAFRAEALAARDSASRLAVAQRISAYLGGTHDGADTRQAIDVLDKLPALPARDELMVARAASAAGLNARAVTSFARSSSAGALAPADLMTYAGALSRSGKSAEAVRVYALLSADATYAAPASYQRARALVAANDPGAKAALRNVATQFASAQGAAAPALFLLADLEMDGHDPAAARQSLSEMLSRYPNAAQAPLARFRAGLIDFTTAPAAAAAAWDSLVLRHPKDDEALAARYWAARAYEKTGKTADAHERFASIVRDAPLTYYALRSATRLGERPWAPPGGSDSAPHVPAIDSVSRRIATLRLLGMDVEAKFEMDALVKRAESIPSEASAAAQALSDAGDPGRALRVALAALASGTPSRALYRLAYPVLHEDALRDESSRNALDPALVAGLIRQESSWNPRAVSVANARGLMQLIPSVAASVAAGKGYPLWNTALLFEPDVNLELGTSHLASSLRRGTPPERALAAYNAGGSRVTRWLERPGADDPELFTDWIPFTETRDYVRVVLRNAAVYRALYDLK